MAKKPEGLAAYIAAHPERVHGGVQQPVVSRARDGEKTKRGPATGGLWGWCNVTHERVFGLEDTWSAATKRHIASHPGGCRIECMVLADGSVCPPTQRFGPVNNAKTAGLVVGNRGRMPVSGVCGASPGMKAGR